MAAVGSAVATVDKFDLHSRLPFANWTARVREHHAGESGPAVARKVGACMLNTWIVRAGRRLAAKQGCQVPNFPAPQRALITSFLGVEADCNFEPPTQLQLLTIAEDARNADREAAILYYTGLFEVAAARGHTELRVTDEMVAAAPGYRIGGSIPFAFVRDVLKTRGKYTSNNDDDEERIIRWSQHGMTEERETRMETDDADWFLSRQRSERKVSSSLTGSGSLKESLQRVADADLDKVRKYIDDLFSAAALAGKASFVITEEVMESAPKTTSGKVYPCRFSDREYPFLHKPLFLSLAESELELYCEKDVVAVLPFTMYFCADDEKLVPLEY